MASGTSIAPPLSAGIPHLECGAGVADVVATRGVSIGRRTAPRRAAGLGGDGLCLLQRNVQLTAGCDPELRKDPIEVGADGSRREVELLCDIAIR